MWGDMGRTGSRDPGWAVLSGHGPPVLNGCGSIWFK